MSAIKSLSKGVGREGRLGLFLIVAAGGAIFVVMIIPLIYAAYACFYKFGLGETSNMAFIFFDNYVAFFKDPVAIQSLGNTVLSTILNLALCVFLGVSVSVLLASLSHRMRNFLRAVFSMLLFISSIIVRFTWR